MTRKRDRMTDRERVEALLNGRKPDRVPVWPFADNAFDRFVSAYVLDLLPVEEIHQLFNEAHRVLCSNGVLALAGLSHGKTVISKGVTGVWRAIHRINPKWVGGCRPLELGDFIRAESWHVTHQEKISQFGITSEVLVAEKIAV